MPQEPPGHATDGNQLLELLGLLLRTVEANKGEADNRDMDAHSLAAKFFFHGASALYLSRGTNIPDFPGAAVKFIDSASMIVLARTAFETFLTFHYVFASATTKEELDYRHLIYTACGLKERQRIPASAEEHKEKLADEEKQLEALCAKLSLNGFYTRLTATQQTRILKLPRESWRMIPVDGKWRQLHWHEIAIDAGLSEMLARSTYSYLSGYAHSGSSSVFQIKQQLDEGWKPQLIEVPIITTTIAAANLIYEYAGLFDSAKTILGADKSKNKVDEWRLFGQKLGNS